MKVLIKSLTLGSKIMSQTISMDANTILNDDYKPLGWCIYKGYKNFVFHNEITGDLRRLIAYSDVKVSDTGVKLVNGYFKLNNHVLVVDNTEKGIDVYNKAIKLMFEFKSKGQFFI